MVGLAAAAQLVLMCAAATSLVLALPVAVAAESLRPDRPDVARRFWLIVTVLPLPLGLLLAALGFVFLQGDIAATPHQEYMRPHLCLTYLLGIPDAPFRFRLYATLTLALLLFAALRFAGTWLASLRAERLAGQLLQALGKEGEALELPTADPLCFTVGLGAPVIITSQGLREQLSAPELAAVLSHERAHVAHQDGLAEVLVRLATDSLVFLPTTHYALSQFRAACERYCDQVATDGEGKEVLESALRRVTDLELTRRQRLQGELAVLRPVFASHASPARRLAALQQGTVVSLAPSLGIMLGIEGTVTLAALLWLLRPLHDTLYCWAETLLHLLGA